MNNTTSLQKDFLFILKRVFLQFHIYFAASFAFYYLVLNKYSQTSGLISFNIETLNPGGNPPL